MKRRTPDCAAVRITVHADGYRVSLRKSRAQQHDTIVGDGTPTSFEKAFGDALIVARILGAELVIASEAIAKFAEGSTAFGDSVAGATIVEIFEPREPAEPEA